jgi:hypothetical protein
MVPCTGFEPVSRALRMRNLRPLDQQGIGTGEGDRTLISGLKVRNLDQLNDARKLLPAWALVFYSRSPTQEHLVFSFESTGSAWVDIEPKGHDKGKSTPPLPRRQASFDGRRPPQAHCPRPTRMDGAYARTSRVEGRGIRVRSSRSSRPASSSAPPS